jgi:hypothetical protein
MILPARLPQPVATCLLSMMLGLACDAALAQSSGFRLSDLDLRDPHVFVDVLGCRDVTDTPFLGFAANAALQDRIQQDADGDGLLDLSYLIEFLPLDRAQPTNLIDFGGAECTAPISSADCSPVLASAIAGDATLQNTGICSEPDAGTTRPYSPGVTSSGAPCFGSPSGSIALDLGGIPVILERATVAATFVGNPGDSLVNGLLRGFIRESDANVLLLPPTLPLVGGQPLSSLLPGGTGNCAAFSDIDTLEGEAGWWFYLNFTAARVDVIDDTFGNGFRDGFEAL